MRYSVPVTLLTGTFTTTPQSFSPLIASPNVENCFLYINVTAANPATQQIVFRLESIFTNLDLFFNTQYGVSQAYFTITGPLSLYSVLIQMPGLTSVTLQISGAFSGV